MSDTANPCNRVFAALATGTPVNPKDALRCRIWILVNEILRERSVAVLRIPIGPRPGEEETIPSIRDLLINELIIDALKNPSFGQGLFGDLQVSGLYTEALRGFVDELDGVTKNLRAELEGLERK